MWSICFSKFLSGGKHSLECTLILTEGDSAKSLAVSGLGVIGRDRYGVFPLRGKILNVREASHKQVCIHIYIYILPYIYKTFSYFTKMVEFLNMNCDSLFVDFNILKYF